MSFTNSSTTRVSGLVRIAIVGLIAAIALLTALDSTSEAAVSKSRAMGVASKIAKSRGKYVAAGLRQDVGGNWYGSGYANSCRRSASKATCRITFGAMSPEYGSVICTATAKIRFSGSRYSYRLSNFGRDCAG
jgi:hypothetical protein